MVFDKLKGKVDKLKDDVAGAAVEKVDQLMGDFSEAIPTIKGLGLSVSDFRIGMGVIPEIEAKLTGSVEALDADKIQELIESSQENDILIYILKALRTASNLKERLGGLGFEGVEVDVKLGLPPRISVGFI